MGLCRPDMSGVAGRCKPVDVLEDSGLSLTVCWPVLPPDQLGFDSFEERLDRGVVIAITLVAH